jgi:hypothetical protein
VLTVGIVSRSSRQYLVELIESYLVWVRIEDRLEVSVIATSTRKLQRLPWVISVKNLKSNFVTLNIWYSMDQLRCLWYYQRFKYT